MKTLLSTFGLVMALLIASACGSAGYDAQDEESLRIVFVTHGQAADPFWSVVQNGARRAGRHVNARVEYQAPESFDMVAMSQLIDAAVASSPHGLVVSMPDPDALGRAVRAAIDAGIPVVSINSGYDAAERLGVLAHVGQTEYEAGFGGGEQLASAGVTNAFCINNEVGNAALDLRCEGAGDALREHGGRMQVLAVEIGDPTETQRRIEAALSAAPGVDGILTLGPTSAVPALRALRAEGRLGEVTFATFDLSPEILDAVEAGEIRFAIDQQPYVQGYMPVVLLSLHLRNANDVAERVLRTGPSFVTSDNVRRLRELTRLGTR